MSSFNPLDHLVPKDNTIKKLTAKERKIQAAKRSEISGQLSLSFLRDKLLDLSQHILVQNDIFLISESKEICGKDLNTLIGSLNVSRFNDVTEERLSMNKCCNLKCPNILDMVALEKARTLRFILSKEKGCEKIDSKLTISFCDGNLANS